MNFVKVYCASIAFIGALVFPHVGLAQCATVAECAQEAVEAAEAASGQVSVLEGRLKKLEEALEQKPWGQTDMTKVSPSVQVQAQATCTAIGNGTASWITAVPRACNDSTPSCTEICSTLAARTDDPQLKAARSHSVIGALHVYGNEPAKALGRVGLKTHTYASSTWGNRYCGPNYCCCSSK